MSQFTKGRKGEAQQKKGRRQSGTSAASTTQAEISPGLSGVLGPPNEKTSKTRRTRAYSLPFHRAPNCTNWFWSFSSLSLEACRTSGCHLSAGQSEGSDGHSIPALAPRNARPKCVLTQTAAPHFGGQVGRHPVVYGAARVSQTRGLAEGTSCCSCREPFRPRPSFLHIFFCESSTGFERSRPSI